MVQMWYKCAVFNNKQPQENHYKNKDKEEYYVTPKNYKKLYRNVIRRN